MHKVDLWNSDEVGLIIKHPTGVIYTNQTGGTLCDHMQQEGYYIPLREFRDWWEDMHKTVCGSRGGWDSKVPLINDLLTYLIIEMDGGLLEVDPDCLDDLQEAWIPVRLKDGSGRVGVVVYGNCD